MKDIFLRIKEKLSEKMGRENEEEEKAAEEYVELGPESIEEGKAKIIVRPFVVEDFDDIKQILDVLREGYTIAVIDIRELKQKDIIELKRVISKIKKTADALEGDIAGFGESTIIVTPNFAEIYKAQKSPQQKQQENPEPEWK